MDSSEWMLLVILSAFCSFLHSNVLLAAGVLCLEKQFLGISLETAAAGGIFLLLFFLLYSAFLPRRAYVVILTALCVSFHIPLLPAIVCALLLEPGSWVGMMAGTILSYTVVFLKDQTDAAMSWGEELLQHLLRMPGKIFGQEELILTLVVLTAVFFTVYLLHLLPVKYSWRMAWMAGIAVYFILNGFGAVFLGKRLFPERLLANGLLGAAAGILLEWFCFRLDYDKVRKLQFEDDDYYYYVKAVPKLDRWERDNETEQEEEEYYLD